MPCGIVIFLLVQKWYYIRLLTARRAISLGVSRISLHSALAEYHCVAISLAEGEYNWKNSCSFEQEFFLAPPVGLEPTTLRLTAACSTDWAIEEYLCRHRPIFPWRHHQSIFGTDELNCCVRDGNRCTLIAKDTDYATAINGYLL